MVRIWKRQARESGPSAKLTPILPLVLAQDKDPWKTSTHFHDLFAFRLLQPVHLSNQTAESAGTL
jgi:hypothetical protein